MSKVIEKLENEKQDFFLYWFFCPGCGHGHGFDNRWTFNGNYEKPTFSPSLLVNASRPESRCHSFVRNGKIEYQSDCHHTLAGKTIDMLPVDGSYEMSDSHD